MVALRPVSFRRAITSVANGPHSLGRAAVLQPYPGVALSVRTGRTDRQAARADNRAHAAPDERDTRTVPAIHCCGSDHCGSFRHGRRGGLRRAHRQKQPQMGESAADPEGSTGGDNRSGKYNSDSASQKVPAVKVGRVGPTVRAPELSQWSRKPPRRPVRRSRLPRRRGSTP